VAKPVRGSVRAEVGGDLAQQGVDYEVDYDSGLLTFANAPDAGAEVRAGYEFDVPVRFDTDVIMTSVSSFQAGEVPNVPVIEVRL
ncbi:DUF2460 domain-containing protein, partial [Yoonia sp.]|uniref:DUF2460 domain-containing protein n=1 Tax=Yoonia sp. TaxID=2212373 RepID=UPI003974F3E0